MAVNETRGLTSAQNSPRSAGPRTVNAPETPRRNSLQASRAEANVVSPIEEAAEVERRFAAFREEIRPSGTLGLVLTRRIATLSVRMERCAEAEMLSVADRASRAMVEFEVPDDIDPAAAMFFREDAARLAAFDASKEATLLRRYEAAAERGFFRALKELRLLAKQAKADDPVEQAEIYRQELGSFLDLSTRATEFEAEALRRSPTTGKNSFQPTDKTDFDASARGGDVPFTVGRTR